MMKGFIIYIYEGIKRTLYIHRRSIISVIILLVGIHLVITYCLESAAKFFLGDNPAQAIEEIVNDIVSKSEIPEHVNVEIYIHGLACGFIICIIVLFLIYLYVSLSFAYSFKRIEIETALETKGYTKKEIYKYMRMIDI